MSLDKEIVRQAVMSHWEQTVQPYDTLVMLDSGFDAVWAFSEMLNGCQIYVPTVRNIFAECLKMEAVREFSEHGDVDAAARKFGFTKRHFRRFAAGR